jgi:hypothetical protein
MLSSIINHVEIVVVCVMLVITWLVLLALAMADR